ECMDIAAESLTLLLVGEVPDIAGESRLVRRKSKLEAAVALSSSSSWSSIAKSSSAGFWNGEAPPRVLGTGLPNLSDACLNGDPDWKSSGFSLSSPPLLLLRLFWFGGELMANVFKQLLSEEQEKFAKTKYYLSVIDKEVFIVAVRIS